ncbi:MAG TPA: LptE family protein [Bacteroidales bacterium]|nr:LptE family protein [Bacteroidales bacterium]HPM18262.1 LptE family protein [Bacteroidales bacterium]
MNYKKLIEMRQGIYVIAIILLIPVLFHGCKVTYSFSGASISPEVKTISIQYFQNRASLVQPALSQNLTDALIDKCKSQTSLSFVNGLGDVNFEGEITDYNTRPLTVSADAQAAVNRFTITVRVEFTNAVDPDLSYEQTFSRFEDYDSALDLSQVEDELSRKIIEMIVEDIFNRAFVNW